MKRALPILSRSVREFYAARFVMTLGLGTAAGMEIHRTLRAAVKGTGSPSLLERLPEAEAALRSGATLTEAVDTLGLLDSSTLGTLAVAEATGTLDETLVRASRELQDSALRSMQILMIALVVLVGAGLIVKVVVSILGDALGPMKTLYDAAGTGNLDRL